MMRRGIGLLVVLVVSLVGLAPAQAWVGGHELHQARVFVGPRVFIGPGPLWYPYPYYWPRSDRRAGAAPGLRAASWSSAGRAVILVL
jgi:hypothetical protein